MPETKMFKRKSYIYILHINEIEIAYLMQRC